MAQAQCLFSLSLPDGDNLIHECLVPRVPAIGDIVGMVGISGKPYITVIARVRRVGLILDISDTEQRSCLYGVILELLNTAPINTPYEIVRRL